MDQNNSADVDSSIQTSGLLNISETPSDLYSTITYSSGASLLSSSFATASSGTNFSPHSAMRSPVKVLESIENLPIPMEHQLSRLSNSLDSSHRKLEQSSNCCDEVGELFIVAAPVVVEPTVLPGPQQLSRSMERSSNPFESSYSSEQSSQLMNQDEGPQKSATSSNRSTLTPSLNSSLSSSLSSSGVFGPPDMVFATPSPPKSSPSTHQRSQQSFSTVYASFSSDSVDAPVPEPIQPDSEESHRDYRDVVEAIPGDLPKDKIRRLPLTGRDMAIDSTRSRDSAEFHQHLENINESSMRGLFSTVTYSSTSSLLFSSSSSPSPIRSAPETERSSMMDTFEAAELSKRSSSFVKLDDRSQISLNQSTSSSSTIATPVSDGSEISSYLIRADTEDPLSGDLPKESANGSQQTASTATSLSSPDQTLQHSVIGNEPNDAHPNEISSIVLTNNTLVDEDRLPVARSTPARATPAIGNRSVRLSEFYESFVSSELLTGEPTAQILDDEETGTDADAEVQEVEAVTNEEEEELGGEDMDEDDDVGDETRDAAQVQDVQDASINEVEEVEKTDPSMEIGEVEAEESEREKIVVESVPRARRMSTIAASAACAAAARSRRDREHKVLKGRVNRTRFRCVICDKTYVQKNHLKKHLVNHAKDMCISQRPGAIIQCSICDRICNTKSGLMSHTRSHAEDAQEA